MRLLTVLVAAACLAGCANAPDLACLTADDSMVAWRDQSGKVYALLEMVAGKPYAYGQTEGELWQCVTLDPAWPMADWCAARAKLGVPVEWCATGPGGDARCPECEAVPTWGAIKALYR